MRKFNLGISVLLFFLTFTIEGRAQCSCVPDFYTAYNEFEASRAVFVGEVLETQKGEAVENSNLSEFDVSFKVLAAWKTDMPLIVSVINVGSASSEFEIGKVYLVYARFRDGSLRANIGCCNRTKLFAEAVGDLKTFRREGVKKKNIVRR
jgi:hypothetical protein